jgi:hypothetical protein
MTSLRATTYGVLIALLLAGCSVRSISNSGYPGDWNSNGLYRGELGEFDVIGIDASHEVTDAEIAAQFSDYTRTKLHHGEAIMVIQSGALMPDEPMLRELDRIFETTPFSGIPVARSAPAIGGAAASDSGYAKRLRLAAAKGGYEAILCYWGTLEAAREGHATKLVSWVPVVGSVVPDETQEMRIRLRVAVIEVKSGHWSMFSPETFSDAALTAALLRRQSDQDQVALLKDKAYKAAVSALVARYVE